MKINKLLISLTNRCQNCCPNCTNKEYWDSKDGVDLDLIKKIKPICEDKLQIGFCGGEPLLRFDLIQQIVELFPGSSFYIFTNGILLNEDIIMFFKEYKVKTYVSIDGFSEVNNKTRRARSGWNNDVVIDNYFLLKKIAPEITGISTVLFEEYLSFKNKYLEWINHMEPTYWQYFLNCNKPIEGESYPNLINLISGFRTEIKKSIIVEPIEITNCGKTHQSDVVPLYIRGDGSFEIPIWGRTWNNQVANDHLLGNNIEEIIDKYNEFTEKYGPLYQTPITPFDEDKCKECPLFKECEKTKLIKREIITTAEKENCILLCGGLYESS